jgi:uncharacterized protein with FMN-binding domain
VPRRGAVALVTTVLAVLLLFSFKPADQSRASGLPNNAFVGNPAPATQGPVAVATQPAPTPQTRGGGSTATQAPQTTPAPTANTANGGTASGTFTGNAINTPYGTVQIALVVQNGQIVDVQELQLPSDRQLSAQISREAGPLLRQEVLQAQSANINGVSGASYTSYGFYLSLQSALSQMQ